MKSFSPPTDKHYLMLPWRHKILISNEIKLLFLLYLLSSFFNTNGHE